MTAAMELGENVEFRSPMPARSAFALARALVVPSRAESMPYLVLEAAAAGKPIIATNVGGIPEVLTGNVTPTLVSPGDPAALAAALRAYLEAPEAWPILSPALVKQKFSLEAMAARIEAIYRSALERRYSVAPAGAVAEIDAPR
jgi:glycosyltransferase involved in cell wall biosynthesis